MSDGSQTGSHWSCGLGVRGLAEDVVHDLGALSDDRLELVPVDPSRDRGVLGPGEISDDLAMPDILTVAWMAGSLNNYVDRRAIVQLAATLVAAPLLGVGEPTERLAYALIGPTTLQEDTITFLGQRTVGLHRIEPMF